MLVVSRVLSLAAVVLLAPAVAQAQSPSPTLPSDTLRANYAPKSAPGPTPELAPSLPSDTLNTNAPMVVPDSAAGEIRDSDHDDGSGEPWRQEDEDEVRMEALQFKLG